jgi:hypothetical protein
MKLTSDLVQCYWFHMLLVNSGVINYITS